MLEAFVADVFGGSSETSNADLAANQGATTQETASLFLYFASEKKLKKPVDFQPCEDGKKSTLAY